MLIANPLFGLTGIVWVLAGTEILVFLVGAGLWLASQRAIDHGLTETEA